MPHELTLDVPLRSRDVDSLGHVNQAVYHELLEDARVALLGGLGLGMGGRFTFVLARVELDYRREVRLEDGPVRLWASIGDVGRSSVTVVNEVHRADGVLAATGRAVLVAWDGEARGSRPLTDEERSALGAGDRAAA